MSNGTTEPAAAARRLVPWQSLKRLSMHRTSDPTNDALRKIIGEIAADRGRRATADTVIYAAIRLAVRDNMDSFIDEIREVESDMYPVDPHEPGE